MPRYIVRVLVEVEAADASYALENVEEALADGSLSTAYMVHGGGRDYGITCVAVDHDNVD